MRSGRWLIATLSLVYIIAAQAQSNSSEMTDPLAPDAAPLNLDKTNSNAPAETGSTAPAPPQTDPPAGETNSVEEMVREEVAPPPESPQPGAPESDEPVVADTPVKLGPGQSKTNKVVEVPNSAPLKPAERHEKYVPRPQKIDADSGDYYYGAEKYDDSIRYGTDMKPEPFSKTVGVEAPNRITAQGEYFYKVSRVIPKRSASLRGSYTAPPKITNPKNDATFEDLYGKTPITGLMFDYEWFLTRGSLGRIGLKAGSGLWTASGSGRFAARSRATEAVEEKFTFVTFPNTITLSYFFQMSSTQWIVPFVEGGAGYFTFMEIRDDGKTPKIGGSATLVGAGGMRLLLDRIDPSAVRSLENDFGIRHAWLVLEGRVIVGLNKTYDFTSVGGNAGVAFDF